LADVDHNISELDSQNLRQSFCAKIDEFTSRKLAS
jgi:hypothetical protein